MRTVSLGTTTELLVICENDSEWTVEARFSEKDGTSRGFQKGYALLKLEEIGYRISCHYELCDEDLPEIRRIMPHIDVRPFGT